MEPEQFYSWLKKAHPEIHLLPWQQDWIEKVFSYGRGAGKSTVIRLLNEYEQTLEHKDVEK